MYSKDKFISWRKSFDASKNMATVDGHVPERKNASSSQAVIVPVSLYGRPAADDLAFKAKLQPIFFEGERCAHTSAARTSASLKVAEADMCSRTDNGHTILDALMGIMGWARVDLLLLQDLIAKSRRRPPTVMATSSGSSAWLRVQHSRWETE